MSSASNSFTGSGAGLTSLSASNLGSGTLPDARLSGTYTGALTLSNASNSFTGSGAGLTNVDAATATTAATATNALSLGGVPAANYARKDIGNSFTGNQAVTGNVGVVASASGATALSVQATELTASNIAVSGLADGEGGTGVVGEAENGATATGVWGISSSGVAGAFSGDVSVSGTLSAADKNFKIDHPLDPANKFLVHASVESAEMKTIYDGAVTLDANGEAVVQLPPWFEALNGDFRYGLTCVGGYAPVYIAQKIKNNAFKIAGGTPSLEVDWQVTGVRRDPYAQAHPLVVEVEKPAKERGYYLHPSLYNQSSQRSLEWAEHPEMMENLAHGKGKL